MLSMCDGVRAGLAVRARHDDAHWPGTQCSNHPGEDQS